MNEMDTQIPFSSYDSTYINDIKISISTPIKTNEYETRDKKRILYEEDLVMVFPRRSGGEIKRPEDFTQEKFIHLMLGLRYSFLKKKILQDKQRKIYKTARCFLDNNGHSLFNENHGFNINHRSSSIMNEIKHEKERIIQEKKNILEKEYQSYTGSKSGEPTTEALFCELIAISVVKRLQVACGLTTKMYYSCDHDEIIVTIKADDMDLRTEADRTNYRLQVSNRPFSICHKDKNNKICQQIGEKAYQESFNHLKKIRGCALEEMDLATLTAASIINPLSNEDKNKNNEKLPEIDPLLISNGNKFQRKIYNDLKRWGHNEDIDGNDIDYLNADHSNHKNFKLSIWRRFWNGLMYVSYDPETYFAPYASYRLENKYQFYYRQYPISLTNLQEKTFFRQVDRIRLCTSILNRHLNIEALENFTKMNLFSLHNNDVLLLLKKKWAFYWFMTTQPISFIRSYFGEKIALYFAWLEFYTKMLILPSIIGLIFFIMSILRKKNDGFELIIFSALVVVWSAFFTELWKRKNTFYNTLWGVNDLQNQSQPRSLFLGEIRRNPITDETEMWHISSRKRKSKFLISFIVVFIMIFIVIIALIGLFILKSHYANSPNYSYLVSFFNAIQIIILNKIYKIVAITLNNWENHRTDMEYENFLITKVFLFQFCNSFASFFYIAFMKKYIESNASCKSGDCFIEVKEQLMVLFIVRIIISNIIEVFVPYLTYKFNIFIEMYFMNKKIKKNNKNINNNNYNKATISNEESERQAKLNPYESSESFEDYNEMVIQYGFVTLFVVAFPLTPLLAFINNVIEVHIDATKLCVGHRRPYPHKAKDIGSWFYFLRLMSNIAIITNCALLLFTSDIFNNIGSASTRWLIFILAEHGCLALKLAVEHLINDAPENLSLLIERHKHIDAMVFKGFYVEDDSNLSEKAEKVDLTIHPNPSWLNRGSTNNINSIQ